jgi:hypothetical protein
VYSDANYPDASILRVERDNAGYDFYVSTGYRIEFDIDGYIRKTFARP